RGATCSPGPRAGTLLTASTRRWDTDHPPPWNRRPNRFHRTGGRSIIALRSEGDRSRFSQTDGAHRSLPSAPDIGAGTVAPVGPRKPCGASFSSVSSPIFACKVFTSTTKVASVAGAVPNTPDAPSRSWVRHPRDLVRMDVEPIGRLGKRPLSLDGSKRHLRLEGRAVIPARSSRHGLSSLLGIMPISRGSSTHSPCSDFPSHFYTRWPFYRMSRSSETRASSFFRRRISVSFSASPDDAFANFFQA
ncbi:hypothetical protein LX81_04417, partial [Palleronia aestuarii]